MNLDEIKSDSLWGQEAGKINSNFNKVVLSTEDALDAMQSEINAAQLEIGAVQTDNVPTEGSGNHMTSGGIYNAFKTQAETLFHIGSNTYNDY